MSKLLPSHVTMAEVAQRAGVSIATVSRALRDVPGVGPTTRARIKDVAEELAYVVSPEASRLSRRETRRVALVVPRVDHWYYSAMVRSVATKLDEADLDVLLYQVDGVAARKRFFRDLPARRKVDAVVLIALPVLPDETERLDLMGVHVVVVGGATRNHTVVGVDDRAAAVAAVQHLVDLGHRKVAMIRTDDTAGAYWSSDAERQRGYYDALRANQIWPRAEFVATRPATPRAGALATSTLLALPDPPTAVFSYSDELAIGALQAARAHGLRVPDDVSIIGVDGHPLGELFALSTIDQQVAKQGELAAATTMSLLAGTQPPPGRWIATRLVRRGSTGPPRT